VGIAGAMPAGFGAIVPAVPVPAGAGGGELPAGGSGLFGGVGVVMVGGGVNVGDGGMPASPEPAAP
jgi:hypothetical protein